MHFEGWLDSLHDEDENTQSPVQGTCKYLVPQPPAAAQKLSLQNVQPVPHFQPALETPYMGFESTLTHHPLATHSWWTARSHLLAVLTSSNSQFTAQTLPLPTQRQEALHMLKERAERVYNILNVSRGCRKANGFPNLEWCIFRQLAPKFLSGEYKFSQINWHAIGFKDKLRFEEEVDRACVGRNLAFSHLQARTIELERWVLLVEREKDELVELHIAAAKTQLQRENWEKKQKVFNAVEQASQQAGDYDKDKENQSLGWSAEQASSYGYGGFPDKDKENQVLSSWSKVQQQAARNVLIETVMRHAEECKARPAALCIS